MGPYKPLRNWVDEFIPYYMEISWEFRLRPDRTCDSQKKPKRTSWTQKHPTTRRDLGDELGFFKIAPHPTHPWVPPKKRQTLRFPPISQGFSPNMSVPRIHIKNTKHLSGNVGIFHVHGLQTRRPTSMWRIRTRPKEWIRSHNDHIISSKSSKTKTFLSEGGACIHINI